MNHSSFLQDLSVVLLVAGLVTLAFQRLRLPVVLGYILAGFLIGPHTPPFPLVRSEETISTLSELGVIFLMFSLGLEFSFGKLKQVGFSSFLAAALEIPCMIGLGFFLGRAFGWGTVDSLFLGALVSISSTTIILKVLKETKATRERHAQLILGVLIFEDILAILLLAILSSLATTGSLSLASTAESAWRLGVFLTATFVCATLVVPKILSQVSKFKNAETLLVTSLGICFGVSYLAAKFEYSVALGAFLIGAVMAGTKEARQIDALMTPLRDLFAAVFFVAVGMAIVPKVILENAGIIAALVAIVILGKSVFASLGVFATGVDRKESLRVGMGLSQIGEFSFIIAGLGVSRGVTHESIYPIAVSVSSITTLTTPFLMKHSETVYGFVNRVLPSRFLEICDDYSRSLARKPTASSGGLMRVPEVRKNLTQAAVNILLLAAIFLSAAGCLEALRSWRTGTPFLDEHRSTIAWVGAMAVAMPLQINTVRKIHSLALAVGTYFKETGQMGSEVFRNAFPTVVSGLGILALGVLNVLLSAPLLPPLSLLLVLGGGFALMGVIFRERAINLYKRATAAMEASISHGGNPNGNHPGQGAERSPVLPLLDEELSGEASVLRVPVENMPHVAGRFVKDTELRKRSGASIVCIERDGRNFVNPGPDDVILEGDVLLILGLPRQVDRAKEWLKEGA